MDYWCYRATFYGGLLPKYYESSDIRANDPCWSMIGEINRQLTSFEFLLPTNHRIVMSGMAAYNLFIEVTQVFSRRKRPELEAVYLCGQLPDSKLVDIWKISNGMVTRDQKVLGFEYCGTPTRGWKVGVPHKPHVSMLVPA